MNVAEVAWPSGLRRWFKAPVSSEAWVRIPPLPIAFGKKLGTSSGTIPARVARPSFLWQKILCLLTNLSWWFKRGFVQNTAGEVLWRSLWSLCEYKLRNIVWKKCWGVTSKTITPTLRLIYKMAPGANLKMDGWIEAVMPIQSWIFFLSILPFGSIFRRCKERD